MEDVWKEGRQRESGGKFRVGAVFFVSAVRGGQGCCCLMLDCALSFHNLKKDTVQ